MPIWIPILIIAGSALAGAAIIATIEDILKALKGKRFAVLGMRRTGKTALINFLTKGILTQKYMPTELPKKTVKNHFKLKDLKLEVEESIDVPGDAPDFYHDWKDIVQKADIVLYLLRSDRLMAGDKHTEERVKRDMGQIGRWLKENPKKFPLFIIGTHCDLTTPDLTKLPEDEIGDYEDKLRKMPIFQEIALRGGGRKKVLFIFGSLQSKDATERLVYRIIDQVVNHNG